MKKNLVIAVLMTVATTILLGIIYPLMITLLAQVLFHDQANGQLIEKNGELIGSRIIGQPFVSDKYFHSRPSAAGTGYDAANSSGSNFGPTNQKLIDRIKSDVTAAQSDNPASTVPIDLVTASGSGLDPDITPAAALFQVPRIARVRGLSEDQVRQLIAENTRSRSVGIFGEPGVNVLLLNLALDRTTGSHGATPGT